MLVNVYFVQFCNVSLEQLDWFIFPAPFLLLQRNGLQTRMMHISYVLKSVFCLFVCFEVLVRQVKPHFLFLLLLRDSTWVSLPPEYVCHWNSLLFSLNHLECTSLWAKMYEQLNWDYFENHKEFRLDTERITDGS